MAEVLGIVAGGAGLASLAIQLGESAQKVRRLYNSARQAPETLDSLAFEMETFSLLLQEIERERLGRDIEDHSLLNRCLLTCERSVRRIKATVEKLDTLMRRSSFLGKLRTAAEEKELNSLCNELERAKTSLGLAFQIYSEYRKGREADVIRASYSLLSKQSQLLQSHGDILAEMQLDRRKQSTASTDGITPSAITGDLSGTREITRKNKKSTTRDRLNAGSTRYRYQLRPWFVSFLWELSIWRSHSGWNVRLWTVNFVPDDAEIFRRCRDGDLAGVRQLFQDGLASPYDRTPFFHSVLKDAMRSRNLELCRFVLQSLDTDALEMDELHTALGHFAWTSRFTDGKDVDPVRSADMYRLLMDFIDPTPEEINEGQWWQWIRNVECMRIAENAMPMRYEDLSWQTRFEHAMQLSVEEHSCTANMFLQPLGGDPLDPRLANARTQFAHHHYPTGTTALHAVAAAAASRNTAQLKAGSWIELARSVIANGGHIHAQNDDGWSPFLYILDDDQQTSFRTECETSRLRVWIRLLEDTGIDLVQYGQQETVIWAASRTKNCTEHSGREHLHVWDWNFGPQAEDWSVSICRANYVPIYALSTAVTAPGGWDEVDGSNTPSTILWKPVQEDEPDESLLSYWQWVKEIELTSNPFPATQNTKDFKTDSFDDCLTSRCQDDASEVSRLITATQRPVSRPRSSSQPPLCDHRDASRTFGYIPKRDWLPTYHICPCDSKRRLAPCDINSPPTWQTAFRRCMRGVHQQVDIWKYIDRQMRHFRRQFNTREELRNLPYSSYAGTFWQFDDWREYTWNYYEY